MLDDRLSQPTIRRFAERLEAAGHAATETDEQGFPMGGLQLAGPVLTLIIGGRGGATVIASPSNTGTFFATEVWAKWCAQPLADPDGNELDRDVAFWNRSFNAVETKAKGQPAWKTAQQLRALG